MHLWLENVRNEYPQKPCFRPHHDTFFFTFRYFNGEHNSEMATEACDLLLRLVTCLRPTVQADKTRIISSTHGPRPIIFTNFEEVVASLQAQLAHNRLVCSQQLILLLCDDLRSLLRGHIDRALVEVDSMFSQMEGKSSFKGFAHHKIVFLRACAGKQDTASVEWVENSLQSLLNATESSILSQTVRLELEKAQQNPHDSSEMKGSKAGPHWRNIIRQTNHPVKPIEELSSTYELV